MRAVARAWGLRPLATVRVMAEKHDREKLIDVALDLCITQGYEATTIDQIAEYGWNVSQLRRHLLELSSAMSAEVEMMAAAVRTRVPS